MRRPLVPPEQAAAVVRRNTWQGMAQARVPAAYPVPRVRLPRMLGGLKGAPPPYAPPDEWMWTGGAAAAGEPLGPYTMSFATWDGPAVGDSFVLNFATSQNNVIVLDPAWTVQASGDMIFTYWGIPVDYVFATLDNWDGDTGVFDVTFTGGTPSQLNALRWTLYGFRGGVYTGWQIQNVVENQVNGDIILTAPTGPARFQIGVGTYNNPATLSPAPPAGTIIYADTGGLGALHNGPAGANQAWYGGTSVADHFVNSEMLTNTYTHDGSTSGYSVTANAVLIP